MKLDDMKKVIDDMKKHSPDTLDPNVLWFNIGRTYGVMQQYLDDHPKQKERIMKLLQKES